jgi:dihydroorotate dehydrogenase electron transfer subunit
LCYYPRVREFELSVAEMAAVGGLIQVTCAGPDPGAAPGQICLVLADKPGQPWLRVGLHLAPGDEGGAVFYVPMTHPYARLEPGDQLQVLGPVGRGFRLPDGAAHLLVVASSLDRLLPTIQQALRRNLAVTVLTPRSADLLPPDVEIHRGPLSAELAAWADVVVLDVADPKARAQHIRALAPPRAEHYIQALFTVPMPCGVGACQACWVELVQAKRLACVDGPVFAL